MWNCMTYMFGINLRYIHMKKMWVDFLFNKRWWRCTTPVVKDPFCFLMVKCQKTPVVIAVVPFALAQISVGAFKAAKKALQWRAQRLGVTFCADESPQKLLKQCVLGSLDEVFVSFCWRPFVNSFHEVHVGFSIFHWYQWQVPAEEEAPDSSKVECSIQMHNMLHMLAPTRIGHANLSCKR